MGLQSKKIIGIKVTVSSKEESLEEIRKYLLEFRMKNTRPFIIFTPNPEIISFAQKDEEFKRVVNTAQINIPDGNGIVWAVKRLYGIDIKRLTGVDFMRTLVEMADNQGFRIGLIGGKRGVALDTSKCLMVNHPKLKVEVLEEPEIIIQNSESDKDTSGVAGRVYETMTPPMVEDLEESYFKSLTTKIIEKQISILFVALGFPKQEFFIKVLSSQFSVLSSAPLVLMAVGGSFDYISGRVPRAPLWIRNLGLEWLYRLVREPWRLGRQVKGTSFFYKVMLNSF